MSDRVYSVAVEGIGDVPILAENIRAARRRAWRAFRAGPACVRAVTGYRLCERCDSRPCVCEVSGA